MTVGRVAPWRRLFFEAHTMSVADLRHKVERADDAAPRKMPTAERAFRQSKQQDRLKGLQLTGEYEPSHSLIDEVAQQVEDNALRYIPVEKCSKRDQELMQQKKDTHVRIDAHGAVKVASTAEQPKADAGSDIKVLWALQRRAIAYDLMSVISYKVHDQWIRTLFEHINRPPPPGYAAPTVVQALRADRELFVRMGEKSRDGITSKDGKTKPLDELMTSLSSDTGITFHLLPLPAMPVTAKRSLEPTPGEDYQVHRMPRKGKGKGRGKNTQFRKPPADLKGLHSSTPDGRPICFNFNRPVGCSSAQPGMKCPRGWHLCSRPGCYSKHSYTACNQNPAAS